MKTLLLILAAIAALTAPDPNGGRKMERNITINTSGTVTLSGTLTFTSTEFWVSDGSGKWLTTSHSK